MNACSQICAACQMWLGGAQQPNMQCLSLPCPTWASEHVMPPKCVRQHVYPTCVRQHVHAFNVGCGFRGQVPEDFRRVGLHPGHGRLPVRRHCRLGCLLPQQGLQQRCCLHCWGALTLGLSFGRSLLCKPWLGVNGQLWQCTLAEIAIQLQYGCRMKLGPRFCLPCLFGS